MGICGLERGKFREIIEPVATALRGLTLSWT